MIGVVGAGAFGTALACAWAQAGRDVVLWGRDASAMDRAQADRATPRLADVALPPRIRCTGDARALRGAEVTVLALPMQTLAGAIEALDLSPAAAVAACKGIDLTTGLGPTAILARRWPGAAVAILSGPSFAADIARGLPTALSLGCADDAAARRIQDVLSTPALRLYRAADVAGVELGGALKNVVAIACGAAMGAGLGESARAALMTRGMAEMTRLATALGAQADTLSGLSGLGDLALTCASPGSRNFALGHAIGAGAPRPDATTEGVATATAALALARRHGIDLPITRAVADLAAGRADVTDAMDALLSRPPTTE
ncbi:NAD(P)H-dependent glycerol-3-phosphate dehydrogenase [Jannaschia sp. LMIT008]|uniref:NAD(P)H-dependent glycerol-3-phosphate dehydrogenase n=1 Tax=Jannaschia maritima TaxID=3032585 RepID=UPI0028115C7A|nr:NAD(P)H-dependent glycerol-3-phosphate dehydrogenase [Jannaschia sp. LMIT008]